MDARIRGNLVTAEANRWPSAVYRVRPRPRGELLALALDAAEGGPFSLLWVSRPWSFDRYAIATEASADVRHAHREALAAYLDGQRWALERWGVAGTPELYLCVRLPRATGPSERDGERRVRQRLLPWLGCERASEQDVRWLARRAAGDEHQALLRVGASAAEGSTGAAPIGERIAALEVAGCPVDVALTAAGSRMRGDGESVALGAMLYLSVRAPSPEALERRIAILRAALAPHPLLHLPGAHPPPFLGRSPRLDIGAGADDEPVESGTLAAKLPRQIARLGTEVGPYVGHRVDGPPRGVRFDAREAWRGSSPCVLLAGAAGTGKTLLLQLIMHHAFLTGSVICDLDLSGDHVLSRLPEAREHSHEVELSAGRESHGVLDPLRIAPPGIREQLACALLLDLLATPPPAEWRSSVKLAVRRVAARGGRCEQVIDELAGAAGAGREVAAALADRADSAPAILALGQSEPVPATPGKRARSRLRSEPIGPQLTTLRVAGSTLAPADAPANADREASLRRTLAKLLVLHALRLGARDPDRHLVLGLDRAGYLLSDRTGREVVRHVARMARGHQITALLATRNVEGAERLAAIGTVFCFRASSDRDATQALRLIGLDGGEPLQRRGLRTLERGRCMLRDHKGRLGEVEVEVVNAELAAALGARLSTRTGASAKARSTEDSGNTKAAR